MNIVNGYTNHQIRRFHDSYDPVPECGCWLWNRATWGHGYGSFFVTKKRPRPWSDKAHRASWVIHNGPIPEGTHVLHKCDTPLCVNPDHLFLGTNADNIEDRLSKDRPKTGTRGEQHQRAILTWRDVSMIRIRKAYGERRKTLASEYCVAPATIDAVTMRRSWM